MTTEHVLSEDPNSWNDKEEFKGDNKLRAEIIRTIVPLIVPFHRGQDDHNLLIDFRKVDIDTLIAIRDTIAEFQSIITHLSAKTGAN